MLDKIEKKLRHIFGEVELKQLTGGYTNGVFLIDGQKRRALWRPLKK